MLALANFDLNGRRDDGSHMPDCTGKRNIARIWIPGPTNSIPGCPLPCLVPIGFAYVAQPPMVEHSAPGKSFVMPRQLHPCFPAKSFSEGSRSSIAERSDIGAVLCGSKCPNPNV